MSTSKKKVAAKRVPQPVPTPVERGYHHGDLRAALVQAGLAALSTRNADGLSLRELAREVGVSPTAVYRHFPDKHALMSALARDGLRQLAVAQYAASQRAGGGLAGFNATGRAYVRFALANPALFRLIFSHPAGPKPAPTEGDEVPDALAFLRTNAAELTPPGADPQAVALHGWSLAHGLAMLMLDGQVPVDDSLIDAVVTGEMVLSETPSERVNQNRRAKPSGTRK